MTAPQCPDCDGDGCARCGQTGVAPAEHSPGDDGSTCRDGYGGGCGRPWRACVCVDDAPDALDVAAGDATGAERHIGDLPAWTVTAPFEPGAYATARVAAKRETTR